MAPELPRLPRVKVCGLTRAEDVRAALEAGADALGFVHHGPSPRSLDAEAAGMLVEPVPKDVLAVAVMVDPTPAEALAFLRTSGLRALQLCGAEEAEAWRDFPTTILRRVAVTPEARTEIARWRGIAAGFVLDHPSGPGGTGAAVDAALAAELADVAPCLLAGGLDAKNVGARVAAVSPAGVDASSRLESTPGIKDHAAVRAFVRAAQRAIEALDAHQESEA
ncbi:MAG: phosphoribosylanthranilate isomerase [Planctomycetota bacterium]|nr:phosphoribosylanthranilate isomerase [Planctomycetota bacterium]